jgi:hypothetical protein
VVQQLIAPRIEPNGGGRKTEERLRLTSSTLLFPLLCDPITVIWGRSYVHDIPHIITHIAWIARRKRGWNVGLVAGFV